MVLEASKGVEAVISDTGVPVDHLWRYRTGYILKPTNQSQSPYVWDGEAQGFPPSIVQAWEFDSGLLRDNEKREGKYKVHSYTNS
ncbi:hypothetical protein PMIT1342_01884 [Prochlorococcus marinus str. MIT 1342]|nr:hypothetical protein PMIT1342_01884 [Prochlorococcus marinus str. MIT 1342]